MSRFQIRLVLLFASLSLIIANRLSALESDKDQQVVWSSDGDSTMSIMGNSRILEMNTNVIVTQGTLEIRGNQATFEYRISNNELTKVTVHGTPVHYTQQLYENGDSVTGASNTLLFYTNELNETVLELLGNANIESPDSTISCSTIIYIADKDLIREAVGPCRGSLNAQQN